jgi:hypothetical protein
MDKAKHRRAGSRQRKAPALRPGRVGVPELLAQSGIEHMREPDTGFLQLLPDDRGVHRDIGGVDVYLARGVITGRTLSNAVFRSRLFRDSEGLVGPVLRPGLGPALYLGRSVDFISSVAASSTSAPTALVTRQVSQAECRLDVPHSPVTTTPFPPRSSSKET